MDRLRDLVGVERSVTGVSQALHLAVAERRPPTVGAMHITCADESENECVQAFLKGFVQYVVPPLKFGERSAVRIANLGGRYEWGHNPRTFGHSGAGGSLGFADPHAGISFGFAMTRILVGMGADPRWSRLVDAVYASVEDG